MSSSPRSVPHQQPNQLILALHVDLLKTRVVVLPALNEMDFVSPSATVTCWPGKPQLPLLTVRIFTGQPLVFLNEIDSDVSRNRTGPAGIDDLDRQSPRRIRSRERGRKLIIRFVWIREFPGKRTRADRC